MRPEVIAVDHRGDLVAGVHQRLAYFELLCRGFRQQRRYGERSPHPEVGTGCGSGMVSRSITWPAPLPSGMIETGDAVLTGLELLVAHELQKFRGRPFVAQPHCVAEWKPRIAWSCDTPPFRPRRARHRRLHFDQRKAVAIRRLQSSGASHRRSLHRLRPADAEARRAASRQKPSAPSGTEKTVVPTSPVPARPRGICGKGK